jgi:hypothetical protein
MEKTEEKTEKKNELELDITKIVLDIYTKIARWHNDDYVSDRIKGDALKIVSHDIVQTIVDDIFEQLKTPTRLEVKRGETVVGSEESKDKESFSESNPKDTFSKLFINKNK